MKTFGGSALRLRVLIPLTALGLGAWAAPFTNGGFELPPLPTNTWLWVYPGVTNQPGATNLTGWTVGGSSTGAVLVNGNPTSIALWALEGSQHICFDVQGLPTGGTIAQTFDTEVGVTYVVSFNVGKEEAAPGSVQITAVVTAGDGSVLGTLAAPQSAVGWGPTNRFLFGATTATSTLTFQDTSPDPANTDPGLDNVSVQVCVPYAATATSALANGFVIGASVTDRGFGYTNTPSIRIIGGGGSGAQAVAVVSNGFVVAVNVLDSGFGYTNAPVVVIAPPFIAPPSMAIAPLSLLTFADLTAGTNYQLQFVDDSTWLNIGPAFTSSTFTQYVSGTAGPNDYQLATTPVPSQASAAPVVVYGFVVAAQVTSGGAGYDSSPVVSIIGGGGSNATATATVSGGAVTAVMITDAGIGYTNTPAIVIAPPPPETNTLLPTVQPVMQLNVANLSPYDDYQVEFSPAAAGPWSSLGDPFTPTAATSTQCFNVSGSAGFFRVKYLP